VLQLVEALRYKPEGRGFDSKWGRLNNFCSATRDECYEVLQLVEALRYKPKGRGFDSKWGRLDF
jgi:2-keto-3-deoxy-L-rhamnonate aldolase RhmA